MLETRHHFTEGALSPGFKNHDSLLGRKEGSDGVLPGTSLWSCWRETSGALLGSGAWLYRPPSTLEFFEPKRARVPWLPLWLLWDACSVGAWEQGCREATQVTWSEVALDTHDRSALAVLGDCSVLLSLMQVAEKMHYFFIKNSFGSR